MYVVDHSLHNGLKVLTLSDLWVMTIASIHFSKNKTTVTLYSIDSPNT